MWDDLKHSGSLKNSYIQTLESQIHLVKPKLVFLRNKYHIHYVFGSSQSLLAVRSSSSIIALSITSGPEPRLRIMEVLAFVLACNHFFSQLL